MVGTEVHMSRTERCRASKSLPADSEERLSWKVGKATQAKLQAASGKMQSAGQPYATANIQLLLTFKLATAQRST